MGPEFILGALAAGAAAASQDIASQAVKDAYHAFRSFLKQRLRGQADAEAALDGHVSDPKPLEDALVASGAAAT